MNFSLSSAAPVFFLAFILTDCSESNDATASLCNLASVSVNGYATTYAYTNNKLTGFAINTVSGGGAGIVYTIAYDQENRISTLSLNGAVIDSYAYDVNNRIISTTTPSTTYFTPSITYFYSYNTSGQRLQSQHSYYENLDYHHPTEVDQIDTYQYPNTTTHNPSSKRTTINGSPGETVAYTYDNKSIPGPFLDYFEYPTSITNNVTQAVTTLGGSVSSANYTYTYNSNGYPLTQTLTTDANMTIITDYTYTDCKLLVR